MPTYPEIAFFAFDWGPFVNMQFPLAKAIGQKGFGVRTFSKVHAEPDIVLAGSPQALVLSLASQDRASDIPLLEATLARGIPCVVVCETHHTWARPGLLPIGHCKLLVAAPGEVAEARDFGYGEVAHVTFPPGWQNIPSLRPALVERQGSEKLIYVSGVKDAADTDRVLLWCVQALVALPYKCKLIISIHPSEDPATINRPRRQDILGRLERYELHKGNGDVLQVACDLAISPAACSAAIVAALRRQPCVCPMDDHFVAINTEKQMGRPYFFPVDPAVDACALCSPETLTSTINRLLTDEAFAAEQRRRQEIAYPFPNTVVPSADIIAEFILREWL